MVDHFHSLDAAIVADAFDDEAGASAHVELHFEPGNARAALKLLCRVLCRVLVEARKKDGDA